MPTLLLTGASGDIGAAILETFKAQDYDIIAPSRLTLDLQSQSSIDTFLANLHQEIDVFIHCAGFNHPKEINELKEADIQKTFMINTLSFYSISRFLSKQFMLKKRGAILGVSSIYGDFSRKGRLAYAASKHALNGMVKTLALELGGYNVTVNAVAPGFVDTKMTRQNNSPEVIKSLIKKVPMARLANTKDIAEVIHFLCSPKNTYINGQCIIVDGGFSVGGFQE